MNYLRYIVLLCVFAAGTPVYAQIISTVAGPGNKIFHNNGNIDIVATITNTNGVAVDDAGNVYVAEYWDASELYGSIFKFDPFDTLNKHVHATKRGETIPPKPGHISYPHGVAVDHAGNIYVAEYSSHRALKMTPGGKVTVIAGNGESGYSGDNGKATDARLSLLNGIAVDKAGNVYLADEFNNAIRKVTPDGIITTFAGSGGQGYMSDGVSAKRAQMNRPYGVTVSRNQEVFISDCYNNVIRKVNVEGIISTFAGNGKSGYSGDGGPATNAQLNKPAGITTDDSANVYVADEGNNVIRKITPGGIITTIAGNGSKGYTGDGGPATNATLADPRDVAVDHFGDMYIADFSNHVIRKVTIVPPIVKIAYLATAPLLTFATPHHDASLRALIAPAIAEMAPIVKISALETRLTPLAVSPAVTKVLSAKVPTFMVRDEADKMRALAAIAIDISPPAISTYILKPVPIFTVPESIDKISLANATRVAVSAAAAPSILFAPVPVFVMKEPMSTLPLLDAKVLAVAPLNVARRSLAVLPVFAVKESVDKIQVRNASALSIDAPSAGSASMATVPVFAKKEPIDKMPLLHGEALSITTSHLITPSMVTVPAFVMKEPVDKIPMLHVEALSITTSHSTTPTMVTVPVFLAKEAVDKMPLRNAAAIETAPSRAVTPSFVIVPRIYEHATYTTIIPKHVVSITLTLEVPDMQAAIVPELPPLLLPDPEPAVEEDKVAVSISTDNVMTIMSERGSYTSFAITNMRGEKVLEQQIKSKQMDVDVEKLKPGQYYLTLKKNEETKTLRFVKEN